MAYTFKTQTANKNNYGGSRALNKIKYIVIHYTGNDGDSDENNGRHFKNNIVKASAHYFVDDDSVTQSVPDNYVAWSVGGNKYSNCNTTGGGKLYGTVNNTNSISVEICDVVKNGIVYPSAETIENALALTRVLMKKYNIPKERVIRHFDVNGKPCPAYWSATAEKNKKWLTEFWDKIDVKATAPIKELETPNDIVWELSQRIEISNVSKAVFDLTEAMNENSSCYWMLRKIANKR